MQQSLATSRLIKVGVNLAPPAAQSQNISSLLFLGSSPVIDVVTRMQAYVTLAQVATDFGTSSPEYLAAVLWFEQSPQPTQMLIGRWAQVDTHGHLYGAPLSTGASLLSAWTAIANGAFDITIDANPVQHVAGLNFAAAASLNGVAAIIGAVLANATIVYNAVYNRFEIGSNSTGAGSIVSFAATPGAGTDISGLLGMQVGSTGAYQANGIVAESAVAAVTLFDQKFGQQWYAVAVGGAVNADHIAIANYIEGAGTKHYYGVTTQDANTLSAIAITDIAYQLKALGLRKTGVQYSSLNPYAVVSLLARILTTDYTANKSVITLMYKQEPGIGGESLSETQAEALEGKNCNVFATYNNNTAIIQPGVSASGDYIDVIIGTDALGIDIQAEVFNTFYTSPTKISQTDDGLHIIITAIEKVCLRYENNGLLAAGAWNSEGFGAVSTGDWLPKGYYVFVPPIAQQDATSRSARITPPIQIAVKLGGAIHKANIAITVNS